MICFYNEWFNADNLLYNPEAVALLSSCPLLLTFVSSESLKVAQSVFLGIRLGGSCLTSIPSANVMIRHGRFR